MQCLVSLSSSPKVLSEKGCRGGKFAERRPPDCGPPRWVGWRVHLSFAPLTRCHDWSRSPVAVAHHESVSHALVCYFIHWLLLNWSTVTANLPLPRCHSSHKMSSVLRTQFEHKSEGVIYFWKCFSTVFLQVKPLKNTNVLSLFRPTVNNSRNESMRFSDVWRQHPAQ